MKSIGDISMEVENHLFEVECARTLFGEISDYMDFVPEYSKHEEYESRHFLKSTLPKMRILMCIAENMLFRLEPQIKQSLDDLMEINKETKNEQTTNN